MERRDKDDEMAAQGNISGHDRGGGLNTIKEEARTTNSNGDDEKTDVKEEMIAKVGTKRKGVEIDMLNPSVHKQKDLFPSLQFADAAKMDISSSETPNSKASSSSQKNKDDYELERAKAEMGEVKQENQRLKMYLDQIRKEYHTLEMQYREIVQQDSRNIYDPHALPQEQQQQPRCEEEPEFISLTLGRTSSVDSKKVSSPDNNGLSLGLDSNFTCSPPSNTDIPIQISSSNNSSFEEPDNATAKTVASTSGTGDHNEIVSPQNNNNVVKKARVSVRARCDTPTMMDGCQWRKYGQKIAKGNPCPRAYYRCTVAPNCPVRKQVQRCSQDMSILITTYEGTHNHALPISANAMAATTSAAVTMLLSGSSTTTPFSNITASTTTSSPLHGLNLYLSDNTKSKQLYFPNSPIMSSSPSSIPTVVLDLTSPSSSSSSPFQSSNFNKLSSSYLPSSRFSSPNNLNFSCLESNNNRPMSWTKSGQLSYANYPTQPYNNNNNNNNPVINNMKPMNLDTQEPNQGINSLHQLYSQQNPQHTNSSIAAATKAITSDPSFQSALADALTSIIGAGSISLNQSGLMGASHFGQKLKCGDQFAAPGSSGTSTYQSWAPKCSSGYTDTTRPGSSNSKSISNTTQAAGNVVSLLPPSSSNSLPFSGSKSPATSPSENLDHTN